VCVCCDKGAVCSAFGITRALSFTQDTVVTELLPRRQLAQWEDGIERNKMAVGGEKCIVGYIEKVISEHLEALSIPHRSLWSHTACVWYFCKALTVSNIL